MASDLPLATVAIPTYNGGRFINAAIESVRRQTLGDFEIVVVDDGSTDNTVARVRSFREERLRVIEQPHRGATAALNVAVGAARGEFIGLLDQDDLWAPAKLERHVGFFRNNPGAQLTFSWSGLIDEHDRRIDLHPAHWRGPISFRELLQDYVVGNSSSIVLRRSAMLAAGGFDPRFPRYQDMDLVLRIAQGSRNAVCAVPEELTLYRRHSGQMSRDWRAMRAEWEALLKKCRGLVPAETAAAEGRARGNMNRYFAYLAYEEAEFGAALGLVRAALRSDPGAFICDCRNWRALAACLSGVVLPFSIHRGLEELAGVHRNSSSRER
jgi:glycosyltransferase involved in cell wall biosynthesis